MRKQLQIGNCQCALHIYYLNSTLTFHINSGIYYHYRREYPLAHVLFRFFDVFIHSFRRQKYSYCMY